MPRSAVNHFPDFGKQIHRKQIHGVKQENPDKHNERQWRNELAAVCIVNDTLGLGVDHLDHHFHCCLETPGHARRCFTRRRPQHPATHYTQNNGEKQ
jgi:hypothetical protein